MAKAGAKIFPFLWYAKEAEQAAKFYASIFPDSRVDRVTTMQSESPSGVSSTQLSVLAKAMLPSRFRNLIASPSIG